jgi:LacI family repressor for deo operon, udp, cdd, tsx, nupC, and nupG
MIKMEEVAKLADVSTATVSRVLSGSGKVTEKTKYKVMKAIQSLDYQPNIMARNLRKMETKTILVIVPDISNIFFSKVLKGIEVVAREQEYQILLGNTDNMIERELEYLNLLRQRKADGVILLTARANRKYIEELSLKYPLVLACEYIEGSNIPTVSIDNISSARRATEYLISLGHRRIGYVSGPMNVILNRDRLKGYKQALATNGIELESILVQEGDYSFDSGYKLAMKYFSLENPPTALFSANDEMAIGCVKAAKAMGLRVPEDLSIVGFDNIRTSQIVEPAITTVAQPMYEIGEKAMLLLLGLIKDETLTKRQFVLEDQLIIRDSCISII